MNEQLLKLVKDVNTDINQLEQLLIECIKLKNNSINKQDEYGKTILFYAANEEIVEKLFEFKANPYIKDLTGKSAQESNEYVNFVVKNKCQERIKLLNF